MLIRNITFPKIITLIKDCIPPIVIINKEITYLTGLYHLDSIAEVYQDKKEEYDVLVSPRKNSFENIDLSQETLIKNKCYKARYLKNKKSSEGNFNSKVICYSKKYKSEDPNLKECIIDLPMKSNKIFVDIDETFLNPNIMLDSIVNFISSEFDVNSYQLYLSSESSYHVHVEVTTIADMLPIYTKMANAYNFVCKNFVKYIVDRKVVILRTEGVKLLKSSNSAEDIICNKPTIFNLRNF